MQDIEYYIYSRALHVLAVVLWIGGVAFVTTVLIPALKRLENTDQRLDLFEKLEGRFGLQAKITTVVTGFTGFYMLHSIDGWDRYSHLQFWWLHLMTFVWLIFTIVLFILEPLFLHRAFHAKATDNSSQAFAILHNMHIILLSLSLLAAFGAVAGSHGASFF